MKNIKLKCATAGYAFGDVASVGEGEDDISVKIATQLVKEGHAVEVKNVVKTGTIDTTELDAKIAELTDELNKLTIVYDELRENVIALDITKKADLLKASIKTIQEGLQDG